MVERIRKYFSNKSFFHHKASLKSEDGDENFNELTMGSNSIRFDFLSLIMIAAFVL